jgi:carboxyl-terminal processing protease
MASALALLAGAGVIGTRALRPHESAPPPPKAPESARAFDAGIEDEDEERAYAFRLPSGEPAAVSCEDARKIIAQVRTSLAYDPEPVVPKALAAGTADWLDPHGLWSAATDAPTGDALESRGGELLSELEGRTGGDCKAAEHVGVTLVKWVGELRAKFDHARETAPTDDPQLAAQGELFESPSFSRPAAQLAIELGTRIGAFARATGPAGAAYVSAARDRYFPTLDSEGWARVVLAAAVRAYVPLVDPHGTWAPLDEEESVYEVDLASRPPPRLWDKSERTALGARIGEGAAAPLVAGDLLLSLAGVTTAGLPLEQLDQLSFAAADAPEPARAIVLRVGERSPRAITMTAPSETDVLVAATEHDGLTAERVAYGGGDALVVSIRDVRDDLGDALARTMLHARRAGPRPLAGVVLDLRGNGGGSTDGAIAALGLFMPGMPLFPMRRRDGTIETDRAPEPPQIDRWSGPVATLVDGATASAAEMIAGALAVYHRGPSIGAPTYGKGCAQEYLDDDAHAGVLRLTTLLYALPDGAPVQRTGITPGIAISFSPVAVDAEPDEREATLAHAAPMWRGPDVRAARIATPDESWGAHSGNVGPCKDADVCRALRALAGASAKRTSTKR